MPFFVRGTGQVQHLLLLHLSAATDTVGHSILLNCPCEQRVGGTVFAFQCSTSVNGDYAAMPLQLLCGMLQGAIMSPMQFKTYLKQLGTLIRSIS